jgi:hypothetical protein
MDELTKVWRQELIHKVADYLGMEEAAILEAAATGDECPGICLKCEAVVDDIEPDQDRGWCEDCGKNRIVSVLRLAGLI